MVKTSQNLGKKMAYKYIVKTIKLRDSELK